MAGGMTQGSTNRRIPAVAAALSFVFPGAGQAYAGNRQLAAVFALPVVGLALAILVAVNLAGHELLNALLSASFLTAVLALDAALLGWRMLSIAHAGLVQAPATAATPPLSTKLVVVALLLATIAMHAWAGVLVAQLNGTLGAVFSGGAPGDQQGTPRRPLNQPEYSWDGTDRINFLLLGIDAGPGRKESLTDTILVVSVDPVARTAVMISVPRDTGFMPLADSSVYADGLYPHKINALTTEARENAPVWCPDLPSTAADACGLRTLERSVGLYLGIKIHYYATIDLEGFISLIDAIGTLHLCLPGRLVDRSYSGPGDTWGPERGVRLPAGCSEYDGMYALAYARARKGFIEMPDGTTQTLTDFQRSDRQQQVLLELRRKFADLNPLFDLGPVLQAVTATVHTDFPRAKAGDLASLLPLITGDEIHRVVLGLPRFVDPPVDPVANYMLIARRDKVRAEMRRIFGRENLEGWYLTTDAGPPAAAQATS
jgi:polyisoprenyl-teichoic acid--peptidoglycan teichoic acid transferase